MATPAPTAAPATPQPTAAPATPQPTPAPAPTATPTAAPTAAPTPSPPKADWTCARAAASDDKKCHDGIVWAREHGMKEKPEWYPEGTTTSDQDLHCALYLKAGEALDGESHGCNRPPCASISDSMKAGGGKMETNNIVYDLNKCLQPENTNLVEKNFVSSPGPSIEWWGWVLIVAAVLALITGIAYALGCFGAKKAKKKRAVKLTSEATAEPATATAPVPTPVYEVAPPIYTYTAQPTYTATQSIAVAAPAVVTAPPQYITAPQRVSTISAAYPVASVSMAQPVTTISAAQPVQMLSGGSVVAPVEYVNPVEYVTPVQTTQ